VAEYWRMVPRDIRGNLEFRLAVRKRCATDLEFRAAMIKACREDFLFFCLVFVFLHEPRAVGSKKIPFLVWDHQVPVIQGILKNLGQKDIVVDKCRGEGMSWISVLLALWTWLFHEDSVVGMVSSTEDKSDRPGDVGSLMGKLDWEIECLPKWMVGKKKDDWDRNLTEHTLVNKRTRSQILAFAATKNTGRGNRFTWFFLDELGEWQRGPDKEVLTSLQQATNCRLIVSTPAGAHGAYYDFVHGEGDFVKLTLDWKDNPSKNRGLYVVRNHTARAMDPKHNPLPPGYEIECMEYYPILRKKGFHLEGTTRSLWYDKQCLRGDSTPLSIAQELDRDFGGSQVKIFPREFFERARATVRPPNFIGEIDADAENLEAKFVNGGEQNLCLWTELDVGGKPPRGSYVVCADISQGLGGVMGSNSAAHVISLTTGEQVGELVTGNQPPDMFADSCIGLCKLFHDAFLAWEINGPGSAYTKQVKERGYTNIYMRERFDQRGKKKEKGIGWHTSQKTRDVLFTHLSRMVRTGELVLHSNALVPECDEYLRVGDKAVHQSQATDKTNEAHGDRVIAMGVGAIAMRDRSTGKRPALPSRTPPVNSMEYREQERLKAEANVESEWDERENADLVR
jgi:hypothetical protein